MGHDKLQEGINKFVAWHLIKFGSEIFNVECWIYVTNNWVKIIVKEIV